MIILSYYQTMIISESELFSLYCFLSLQVLALLQHLFRIKYCRKPRHCIGNSLCHKRKCCHPSSNHFQSLRGDGCTCHTWTKVTMWPCDWRLLGVNSSSLWSHTCFSVLSEAACSQMVLLFPCVCQCTSFHFTLPLYSLLLFSHPGGKSHSRLPRENMLRHANI